MHEQIQKALKLMGNVPGIKLGFFPTPLHKLEKLSEQLGVNLYVKRDDFSGISQFGGNKIRKLEFLIAKAMKEGCDTIITYGATQSNHAMQTVTACRRCGLTPILYLVSVVEPDQNELRGNLLLDHIMDAEVHIVPLNNESEETADERAYALSLERIRELEKQGHRCCRIPIGGANAVGSTGFISGFVEMTQQMEEMNITADYVFHASGSGGTLAGLAAGKKLIGSDTRIVAIGVGAKNDSYIPGIVKLANEALSYIGSNTTVTSDDFSYDASYYAPGYEVPNEAGTMAIKELAGTEGILVDPVYTGKAFAGMLDYIRSGKVRKGSNILFWHTGGTTALFAEKAIIGDITSKRRWIMKT